MKGNCSRAPGTVTKLLVRTTLPDFDETKVAQDGQDLSRLQNWDISHGSRDGDVLHPNKFRFEDGFAIFQEHGNDFSQVGVQLIKSCALRMSTRKSRDEADEKTCIRVAFDYCGIVAHEVPPIVADYRSGTGMAQTW